VATTTLICRSWMTRLMQFRLGLVRCRCGQSGVVPQGDGAVLCRRGAPGLLEALGPYILLRDNLGSAYVGADRQAADG
jgi:hypothetical protein